MTEQKKPGRNFWPIGLTIFIISFMVAAVMVVIFSLSVNRDLVTPDYYEKEIAYQQQINRIQRANALNDPMQIKLQNGSQLYLEFPEDIPVAKIAGTVLLFRPDDKRHDIHIPVSVDSMRAQWINLQDFKRGNWRVKIEWNDGMQDYYNETAIFVN